jgi:predicted MFS family arabinose efflux permease
MQASLIDEDIPSGDERWVGPRPRPMSIATILIVGTVGMMMCGVQPLLLGTLVVEGRLSAAGLGWTTTAEFLTLGLGIMAAGAWFRPKHLRWYAALASFAVMVADLAILTERGWTIIANRTVAGLAEGILVWLAGCMIARSSTPARWAGIFLTMQNISQFAFAAVMPVTVMERFGANGGFIVLAFTALLALLLTSWIPTHFVELPVMVRESTGAPRHTLPALASLVSVFLIAAFSIGLFVYIAPLATQAQLDSKTMGFAVSTVLAASTVGSIIAAIVAKRVHYFPIFIVCVLVNAVVLAIFAAKPGAPLFLLASSIFGFSWLFFLPFQLPLVIESDPTRRIAVVLPGAQLLGGAAGPFLCSFFVTDEDSRGALVVCGICFFASFAISAALHLRRRRLDRTHRSLPTMA